MFRGLRSRLLSLVVIALVPLAAFSLSGIVFLAEAKRTDFEQSIADLGRALGSAVDNELQRSIAVAQTLASSPSLAAGDVRGFYEYCQAVLDQQPAWSSIGLATPDGRYVFNTIRPLGGKLPDFVGSPAEVAAAAGGRKPVIGNVGVGRVSGEHMFAVRAPAVHGGEVRYVVSVGVKPDSLQAVLQRQAIPADATVAVLDPARRIVARSRRHAEFVGKPATESLQRIMVGRLEGSGRPETLDGLKTYAAFSTSPQTGWSVVIGMPLEAVGASQRYAYLVLIIGLALSLGLGGAAAVWHSRGIVRPMERLRQGARDIGRGEEVQASDEGFAEAAEVSRALASASLTLRESSELRAALLAREQEARAAAEKSNREKDEFLAMLSHELRNPLAAVTSAVELLRRLPQDSDRVPAARQVMERQLAHLRYLINDLLDVSRSITGKITLSKQDADLAECVRQVLKELRDGGALRDHEVRTDLATAWACIDPHRIEQVATNLLTNAARYSPPGTAVKVSVRADGNWCVLDVADEGIGMDEQTRARIFDLFYQGSVSPSRSQGGLGVGLTLTRRLVELHGGSIEAASAGPGQGSRFTVRLPRIAAAPTAPAHPPSQASESPAPAFPCRVLLVDDNRDHADSLADLLRLHGFTALVTYDGEEAIAAAARFRPDVVVLDLGLPEQDGFEVCRRLRQTPEGEGMQIIALTGWGQDSDRRKTQLAGFDAHLTKPVLHDELVARIRPARLEA